jgi:hypothetical protein
VSQSCHTQWSTSIAQRRPPSLYWDIQQLAINKAQRLLQLSYQHRPVPQGNSLTLRTASRPERPTRGPPQLSLCEPRWNSHCPRAAVSYPSPFHCHCRLQHTRRLKCTPRPCPAPHTKPCSLTRPFSLLLSARGHCRSKSPLRVWFRSAGPSWR